MTDFEGMIQRELDKVNQAIRERDDELSFYEHHVDDHTFMKQCGIAWPSDRSRGE